MSMPANMFPSCHLLHQLRRPQPPHPPPRSPPLPSSSSFVSLFFWPLSASPPSTTTSPAAALSAATITPPHLSSSSKSLLRALTSKPLFLSAPVAARSLPLQRSISCAAFPRTPSPHSELEASHDGDGQDDEAHDIDEEEEEDEEEELGEGIVSEQGEDAAEPEGRGSVRPVGGKKAPGLRLNLSVKEKKELASYAHSLGKKLKSQLVGKSGVNDSVAASFIETLEANELLKIKIHRTCSGELDDVVDQLAALTGSVVVSQIGRTIIIYRPSLTKMKAEEKKREAQRVFMKKQLKPRSTLPKDGQAFRMTARARPRRSRV